METNKKIREQISALGDGELSDLDIEVAFATLRTPEGHHAWEVYHRIGDVMRAQASPDLSPGFTERLAARLADEPMPIRRRAEPRGAEAEPAPAVVAATRS
jgi:sigma-E factor negative regulatory protein RseA